MADFDIRPAIGPAELTFSAEGGPVAPVPEPPRARWQFLTGPASGGYAQELTAAQNRRLTMRLDPASELSFDINARHVEAAGIAELSTDVHARWTSPEGVVWRLFRGRVGSTSDSGTEDQHRMSVTSLDYRKVLSRRHLFAGVALNINSSFEDGLALWTGSGGLLELDDTQHQDRTKSGRLTPDGVTATAAITSDNFAVTAAVPYRLSGWVRCATARTLNLSVVWKNAGGGTISTAAAAVTVDAEVWTRVDKDAVSPALTTQASIVLSVTGTPPVTDIFWLDDARLTTAPQHASRLNWDGYDQADIVWGLIADTQARVAGDLGISNGSTPTGVPRDRTYQVGDSVGDRIQELSEVLDGFDWDITPTSASGMQVQVWHPQRGQDRGVVLTPGGLIQSWRREVQPSEYGNAQRYTGADTTIPRESEAPDLGGRAEGRWDVVKGDTGLTTQAALDERADWQLTQSQVVRPTYSVTLKRGAWMGPGHIWLGDSVRLVIYSGRLRVNTVLRVFEIAFTLDADGGETIVLSVGGPKPDDFTQWPAHQDRRISNLERR